MILLEETLPFKLILKENYSNRQKWDGRFLRIAQEISTWSKDPSTKVGALAVNIERRIVGQGYNGFPSGAKDSISLYSDRKTKYEMVIHAESNIIFNACNSKIGLNLSTIFVFGMYPCPECIKALAQVGVARVVFQLGSSENKEAWENQFQISKKILHELGIGFTMYGE